MDIKEAKKELLEIKKDNESKAMIINNNSSNMQIRWSNKDLKEMAEISQRCAREIRAIETVLSELENSISISKVEEAIEELNQEIENCERRQNEVIALGGDDLHIREEIWDLEDKIYSLKQILEGLDVLKKLQK